MATNSVEKQYASCFDFSTVLAYTGIGNGLPFLSGSCCSSAPVQQVAHSVSQPDDGIPAAHNSAPLSTGCIDPTGFMPSYGSDT
jgi:hypothetical protein